MISTRTIATLAAVIALLGSGVAALADTGRDTMMGGKMEGRFGGPVYKGAPALSVTAALVTAGGGPAKYSTATALTSMVGSKLVAAEVGKLTKQYGKKKVGQWLSVFDFAVADSLKIATAAGVKLPAPAPLRGKALAAGLVKAGVASDGTFQIEYLLDKAVTHNIHVAVMKDIDQKFGAPADANYHAVSNQAFYDLAQALGAKTVKLASFH